MSFKKIRKGKLTKVVACYLALQLIITIVQPTAAFALTSGPSQPEFNAFTPIGTSDMVNLSSGDFNYNLPIMDVGGYPINLAYDSGIAMGQEASWVGLGWNVNVGQIARNVRGLPDDFNGDKMVYENNIRANNTFGVTTSLRVPILGFDTDDFLPVSLSASLGVKFNNYNGITFNSSFGPSFDISNNVGLNFNVGATNGEGANVNASVSIKQKGKDKTTSAVNGFKTTLGIGLNSRQSLPTFSANVTKLKGGTKTYTNSGGTTRSSASGAAKGSGGIGLSFNDSMLFTPANDLSYTNLNLSLNLGFGVEIFGFEGDARLQGWATLQNLQNDEKNKQINAFGYLNTENGAVGTSILDFNRENDRTVSERTNVLPLTNYTYDIYSVQGQGIGGMFRPFRSEVGTIYDVNSGNFGVGGNVGVELGVGAYAEGGVDVKINASNSYSGVWGTQALEKFIYDSEAPNQKIGYEPVYYKMVGELTSDAEVDLFENKMYDNAPVKFDIVGSKFNRETNNKYQIKKYNSNLSINYVNSLINKVKRDNRLQRTQTIQMITKKDANAAGDGLIEINPLAKNHHHAGIKILKGDGSRYVFGETAYNKTKREVTFALPRGNNDTNCATGLVNYNTSWNTTGNSNGKDHFFNAINTPAYAHTYALSSVLSSDYEDLTSNGPTLDDLGAYTKFSYQTTGDYKWRTPYLANTALYNAGLNTEDEDQKASYVYGTKELKFLEKIETKTHTAVFYLSDRHDAIGSAGENGGLGAGRMQQIDSIRLYSRPEYDANPSTAEPIKVAHFEYDYSLCPNIENNDGAFYDGDNDGEDDNLNKGKLTLKKVYFTYRNSNMGKYTPYEFNYNTFNPKYNLKGHDIWGNYKKNASAPEETPAIGCGDNDLPTTAEFPFVDQNQTKEQADKNANAWTLSSINLPSGGKLELEMESDDYRFVQDRKAMQMFKVAGVNNQAANNPSGTVLYNSSSHNYFMHIELPENVDATTFKENYLLDTENAGLGYIGSESNPLYFKFLLNTTQSQFDYVTGYAILDLSTINTYLHTDGKTYASVKFRSVDREGGIFNSGLQVNPVSKAGWYFSRKYLNRRVYNLPDANFDGPGDFLQVGKAVVSAFGNIAEIFQGPNQVLQRKKNAREFKKEKSWVRLYHAQGRKYGGGLRVKTIQLHDNWDVMTDNIDNEFYKKNYGQEYTYNDDLGLSSGVATFEPNGSRENPIVQPFYDDAQRLQAPKESNYVEKPIGESLFPSPTITYSKVVVKNLQRVDDNDPTLVVKKHATGEVISEFYTSRDFPTLTDHTDITNNFDTSGFIGKLLKVKTQSTIALSQGFTVETNDMNGKQKSQRVRSESQEPGEFLSGVDYIYSLENSKKLNNKLNVVNANGTVTENLIGVQYDMITDFRRNTTETVVGGFDGNLSVLLGLFGIPIPLGFVFPVIQTDKNDLKMATATKVIHRTGIMTKKVAYDLGSSVETENLAFDAQTGDVLLTKTINEYGDHYFNFNYPANWHYDHMKSASNNINLQGRLKASGEFHSILHPFSTSQIHINNHTLIEGDRLIVDGVGVFWVVERNASNQVKLMDANGQIKTVSDTKAFKVYRSGYKNQPMASMASITTQKNPLASGRISTSTDFTPFQVVNASAVEYSDAWNSQCEFRLPYNDVEGLFDDQGNIADINMVGFNPYLHNVKGEWRAIKSYAYLTSRNNGVVGYNPRKEGFFKTFTPFYRVNAAGAWSKNDTNWTFASEVTTYSPYGTELENKDALNRYSAAQYGYRYTLPTAVGSNTKYQELAFDGFEDYDYTPNVSGASSEPVNAHFSFKDELSTDAILDYNNSHTGRSSLKVVKDKRVSLLKNLDGVNENPCQTIPSGIEVLLEDSGSNECSKTYLIRANCTNIYYNSVMDQADTFIRVLDRDGNELASIEDSATGAITLPFSQDAFIEIVSCEDGIQDNTYIELKCNTASCTVVRFDLN
ncbi:hypothetical protein [Lacinutrix sp. Hel_I_90]|uniref:hypothetical protein n=1 Tax=Lacinutrix sp. Hel_I_90 TaxID=1249999 RepID=UPI0005C9E69F|nr:hypothetical protein [Lacinutrix sp. Hel_I_90]